MTETTVHSFEPIYSEDSRLLILGTMPSPKSIAAGMYYSHPQNAFWRIMSDLTGDDTGITGDSKKAFLLRHGIALWDTLSLCERQGAADGNIRHEQPNAVADLISKCPKIAAVFLNGGAALKYYVKYHSQSVLLPYYLLPSTSPANARGGYNKKTDGWKIVADFII